VRVVEPLGREILVRAGLVGTNLQLIVQAAADVRLRSADRLSLGLDLNQLFVFDSTTGDTLYP
jgi:multiple sugar transport system ATP-binding protein